METGVVDPYAAIDVGRLKMPTPMMLPKIREVAVMRPKRGAITSEDGGPRTEPTNADSLTCALWSSPYYKSTASGPPVWFTYRVLGERRGCAVCRGSTVR